MKTGSLFLLVLGGLAYGLTKKAAPPTGNLPDYANDAGFVVDPFFNVDAMLEQTLLAPGNIVIDAEQYPGEDAVLAFLYMIRVCEHSKIAADSGLAYMTVAGGSTFSSFADHPNVTGEWSGRPLQPGTCINAGLRPPCISTAAGAYQLTAPTWEQFRKAGDYLKDFSPRSQDIAAIRILNYLGVPDKLSSGDVKGAIVLASQKWASLPGSVAKQNPKSMLYAVSQYNSAFA